MRVDVRTIKSKRHQAQFVSYSLLFVVLTIVGIIIAVGTTRVLALGDLVGYWNFEESSGTTSADTSGTGNSGVFSGEGITITTDVPPTTCYVNERSLHFDGTGSYVNVPDTPSMDPDYISIAFWVKPDHIPSSNLEHIIFKQRIQYVATSYGVWLDTSARIYAEFSDGGASGLAGTTSLTPGQWNYVVVTYDGSDINIYLNGELDNTREYASGPIQYSPNGEYPLKIGHGDYNNSFTGFIDDLRIYNRALTAEEVEDINNGGCGPGVEPTGNNNDSEDPEQHLPEEDLNGDGINDEEQPNVAVVPTSTNKTSVLEVDAACNIDSAMYKAERVNAVQDPGYDYPQGLLHFTVECSSLGFTTIVKQFYYDVSPSDLVARKYNPHTSAYFTINGATITQQTIHSQKVTVLIYHVQDGGALDVDGTANGIIVDPAGLGKAAVGVPNTGLGAR